MNDKLKLLYASFVDDWKTELPFASKLSAPFLPSIDSNFASAKFKLIVVGQQTNGWCGFWNAWRRKPTDEIVAELTAVHANFYNGEGRQRPFFRALDELVSGLAPVGASKAGCLWTNTLPFDNDKKTPLLELQKLFGRASLLAGVIQFANPDAVVFLTGPYYDEALVEQFSDLKRLAISNNDRILSRLESSAFPTATYRTYHPSYLRRSGNWNVLRQITGLIQQELKQAKFKPPQFTCG